MKAVEETVVGLIRGQPFYAHLLSVLNIQDDDRVQVAGYSIQGGKIILHINSFVFDQLTLDNRCRVMIHELLHIIARHSSRQRNRESNLWNVACDIAVNQMIEGIPIKQKVKIKKTCPYSARGCLEETEVGGLTYDNILLDDGTRIALPADRTAEEYYNLLKDKMPHKQQTTAYSLRGGKVGGNNNREDDSGNGSKNKDENSGDSRPLGANLHPTWTETQGYPEELADTLVKKAVLDAINKVQGNVPSSLEVYLEQLVKTRTPWRRILKLFAARQVCHNKHVTFKKQNKRLIEEGMPGFKYDKKLKLIVAVDTSGSIRERELSAFASELLKIKKSGAEITVIECDCQIQKTYKLDKKLNPEFRGRGGTDFRPVWHYIDENKIKPDAVIYLTDGRGQAPGRSKYPTLWALTPEGERPWMLSAGGKRPVDWGGFITIEME